MCTNNERTGSKRVSWITYHRAVRPSIQVRTNERMFFCSSIEVPGSSGQRQAVAPCWRHTEGANSEPERRTVWLAGRRAANIVISILGGSRQIGRYSWPGHELAGQSGHSQLPGQQKGSKHSDEASSHHLRHGSERAPRHDRHGRHHDRHGPGHKRNSHRRDI